LKTAPNKALKMDVAKQRATPLSFVLGIYELHPYIEYYEKKAL